MIYFYWKKGRAQLIGTVVVIAIMVAILPEIVRLRALQDLPTSFDVDTLDRFLAGRLKNLWIPAFRAFAENPIFGRGFNGAGIYKLGQSFSIYPHSGYIATLCDMGILGLIAMLWFFASIWRHCTVIYNRTRNQLSRRLALACKTQVLILAFSNLTSDHSFFYQVMVVTPLFLSVALLFALYREELELHPVTPTFSEEKVIPEVELAKLTAG